MSVTVFRRGTVPVVRSRGRHTAPSDPLDRDGDGQPGGSLPASERLPADVFEAAKALGLDLRLSEQVLRAQIAHAATQG